MPSKPLDRFFELLTKSPGGAVFNPWWEADEQNDIGPSAPAIRRKHLRAYLQQRVGKANLALIGEAVGYRGGHFSGIPMTSERLLLGKTGVITPLKPRRTSRPEICPAGFSEPTTTVVWGTLLRLGFKPDEFVLWNAFPWHSFDSQRGFLSNRTPKESERAAGLPALKAFLGLFPNAQLVAVGKIAAAQLNELGVTAPCVRHPASGGAKLFRQHIAKIAKQF